MKHKIHWIKDHDDQKIKNLLCEKCMKGTFIISRTRVAHQVKTKTAHHMRIVAQCETCGDKRRIAFNAK